MTPQSDLTYHDTRAEDAFLDDEIAVEDATRVRRKSTST